LREFVTAFISFCLVKTLYTLQQTAKALGASPEMVTPKNPPAPGPVAQEAPTAASSWHTSTRRTVEKLGDPASVAFLAFDEYTSKAVDVVANVFGKQRGYLPYWSKLPARLGAQLSVTAAAIGEDRQLYGQMAANTMEIFTLVRNNPEKLGIPEHGEIDLAAFQAKAYGVGDFENIWTVEGLGHVFSQRTWILRHNVSPDAKGILIDGQAECLTEKSLCMMHAGLGLCLAESLIKQVTLKGSEKEVERVLRTFIRLCKENSRPGYAGAALESLGLVTRTFNYPLLDLVQRVLADTDAEAWQYFWRGAGRGLLFSPGHIAQPVFSPWITAELEAPNEYAFNSLKAGITWATNVVNMRHPSIMEDVIKRRGAAEEKTGSIRHGVAASTTMAMATTPNHPVVHQYLQYKPKSQDPKVHELWDKLVREPVYRAVHRYQPILARHNRLEEVFRLQDLDALVDRLEASESNVRQSAGAVAK
jgi:hypothetical protein